MKSKLAKIFNPAQLKGLDISQQKNQTRISLKGESWKKGPLLNEKLWLTFLKSLKTTIQIDLSACKGIGTFHVKWMIRARKESITLTTLKMDANSRKFFEILGVEKF